MDQQKQKQLKVFGYGMPLILSFLGARHGLSHGWDLLSFALFFLAAGFLVIALWNRSLLIKIFGYWMKIAGAIGGTVTTAILIVVYYGVFTPTAWVLKLMGKDFMNRQWRGKEDSYWIFKDHSISSAYTKQF